MKFVRWMVEDSGLLEEVNGRRASFRSLFAIRNTASSCLTGRAEMMCVGDTTDPDFVVTYEQVRINQREPERGLGGTSTDLERVP